MIQLNYDGMMIIKLRKNHVNDNYDKQMVDHIMIII